MIYPYCLQNQIYPLFKNCLQGDGILISLANNSDIFNRVDIKNQVELQEHANQLMNKAKTNWAVSEFGENREDAFRALGHSQMIEEKRFIHLGLDIWRPLGTPIYSPLKGKTVLSEYEEGEGNYGGMVVLEHKIQDQVFYSVYGHLNKNHLPNLNQILNTGEQIGAIGDMDSNGGYFYHLHLQVLTQKGFTLGMAHKGYATAEQFKSIETLCFDPRFLFVQQYKT